MTEQAALDQPTITPAPAAVTPTVPAVPLPPTNGAGSLLSRVVRGRQVRPRRTMIYGMQGIGKSTFAAKAPNPIFIQTEDGLADIETNKLPLATSYADVQAQLMTLGEEAHDYKTVVIDSVDWLEQLIWQDACAEHKVTSIEEFGYGKGYVIALSRWRWVLGGLDYLRQARGMSVILISHAKIERFESPDTATYDRYQPRLNKHAAGLVQEWCDEVLFACYEIFVKVTKEGFNREKARAIGKGDRILRTCERPFCAAKNRLGMPEQIPFTWEKYAEFFQPNQTTTRNAPTKEQA